jgi:uncharacterized membrane protein YqjE
MAFRTKLGDLPGTGKGKGTGKDTGNGEPSTGQLLARLPEQVSRLVRDELRLAQLEVKRKVAGLAIGVGLFGFAALIALFGLGTLVACAVIALDLVFDTWLAALIIGVALLFLSSVALLIGKRLIKRAVPPVPVKAVESVKLDIESVKEHVRR